MTTHHHDFLDCGYDEQQCDSECKSNWHKCGTCGKSRSEIAKEFPADVKEFVTDITAEIIVDLRKVKDLPLSEAVEILKDCSQKLDNLSRNRLVEMVNR
jgi:hypothetical protein